MNNTLAMRIRKLPAYTAAAVHGKLIGGGVALALSAEWRVCQKGATFNVGNLPRGMNPLFMLSRSLPLTIGKCFGSIAYIEDPILDAFTAQALNIVNAIVDSDFGTKTTARRRLFYLRVARHTSSIIARHCVDNVDSSAREVVCMSESWNNRTALL